MISASIVTFNTKLDCLTRLIECVKDSPIEKLYVIDNSPTDSLKEHIENLPKVVYKHNVNHGYGSGHNVGINRSIDEGFKYHIILNPDVYWSGDIITQLRDYMEKNDDCGLIMPKVLYPDGDTQYLCKLLPTPKDLLMRRFLPIPSLIEKHDYNYELRWTGYDKIMEVPVLSGCFMMLRNDIIKKTQGFDERYFMYCEDVDFCRRIGEVSKTIYYPEVSIYHEYAKGSYKDMKLLKMHVTSVIKYFNKWGWFFDKYRRRKNRECIEQLKKAR